MPKSKRPHVVSLTQTKPKGKEHKNTLVNTIRENVDNFKYVYVLEFDNMRTNAFKDLRLQLSDCKFLLGKNRVMKVALGRSPEEEYRDNLSKLGEYLGGNCTLFFTNRPKEEILSFFKNYKSLDYARSGFTATETFVIPKGEMPFAHSMMEEFRKLRLPVEMKNGVINMREEYTVCKEGKVLTPEQCRILKLYAKPMAYFMLTPRACWSNGEMEVLESFSTVSNKHEMVLINTSFTLRRLTTELRHCLRSLRNRMLGQFSRENQTNSSLNLSSPHSALVVHTSQMTSLCHDSLENVRNKRVHHSHSLLRNSTLRMHLLQNLVNIGSIGIDLGGLSQLLLVILILHLVLCVFVIRHAPAMKKNMDSKWRTFQSRFC